LVRITLAFALSLVASGAMAQTAPNAIFPDTCALWQLSGSNLTDCKKMASTAKSERDRQKIRARFEPGYTSLGSEAPPVSNGPAANSNPDQNSRMGPTTNAAPENARKSPTQ
jgi:hypothetical protein